MPPTTLGQTSCREPWPARAFLYKCLSQHQQHRHRRAQPTTRCARQHHRAPNGSSGGRQNRARGRGHGRTGQRHGAGGGTHGSPEPHAPESTGGDGGQAGEGERTGPGDRTGGQTGEEGQDRTEERGESRPPGGPWPEGPESGRGAESFFPLWTPKKTRESARAFVRSRRAAGTPSA